MAYINKTLTTKNAFEGAATLTTVSVSGQLTSNRANNAATDAGQIFLNGATGNRIDFNTNGVAAPSFTTRSTGTKIVLYPQLAATAADYALGIENNTLWSSVPTTTQQFRWYAGTSNIATLTGAGNFSVSSATFGSLTVNGSNVSTSISPTGTGTVTIAPATAGSINNMNIGATTRGTGAFTLLDANESVTFGATTQAISIGTAQTTGTTTIGSTSGTGTITIGQSTAAQNISIATGATANATSRTISIANNGAVGSTTTIVIGGGSGTSTTTLGGSVTANNFSSTSATITGGSINNTPIGATTANTGAFTTISATGNITTAGDLTVNGGDIVLGGTGRIQGIDSVIDNTDAANKQYVEQRASRGRMYFFASF